MFAPDFYRKMERTRKALLEDLEKRIKSIVEHHTKRPKSTQNLFKKSTSEYVSEFGNKYFEDSPNEENKKEQSKVNFKIKIKNKK